MFYPGLVVSVRTSPLGSVLLGAKYSRGGAPRPGSDNIFRLSTMEGRRVHSLVTTLTPSEIVAQSPRNSMFRIDSNVMIALSSHPTRPWLEFRFATGEVRHYGWVINNRSFVSLFIRKTYPNNLMA